MGNLFSGFHKVELYKWSSAEFPEEYALTCTSRMDKSMFSVFRLSVKLEKVLLRLADSLCHDHPVRLHMEVIAERDVSGPFNGFKLCSTTAIVTAIFSYNCERRVCGFDMTRHGRRFSLVNKMTWEVTHSSVVGFDSKVRFIVNIQCDEVTGLSAEFRGPYKCEDLLYVFEAKSDSPIQREVINGRPPKHVNAIVDTVFTGKQFILFMEGKGNSLTDEEGKMVVINNSGTFNGNGNGNGCFN
ncbi:hypothetical protein E2542_SST29075 [Spatholobus suberectus]|nr:hypothetical protein E2542_SST29075 [Spatholobus suberectus]